MFRDVDLNPRAISERNVNLIEEFYYKNPQLHVCLGRIQKVKRLQDYEKVKVLVFDGQHKVVAHIYNGRRKIPIRPFIEYDYEKLKEVNFRAHTDHGLSLIMVHQNLSQLPKELQVTRD